MESDLSITPQMVIPIHGLHIQVVQKWVEVLGQRLIKLVRHSRTNDGEFFLSAPVKKINNYKELNPVRGISPLVL